MSGRPTPSCLRELAARVKAILRRMERMRAPHADGPLDRGALTIDVSHRRVTVDGDEVGLTPLEFEILFALARDPGVVLSREQLLSHVWGYDFDPGSNVVDVYVGYLRRKLGSERFETVRGMGYRLRVQS